MKHLPRQWGTGSFLQKGGRAGSRTAGKAGKTMCASMNGETIMKQLDAMRKTRRFLNRRMKKYRENMEPLSLFQALQQKRAELPGSDNDPRDFRKEIEGEKALYELDVTKPMKKYLGVVESLSSLMVSLPLKEAAALMLYYGLGKSWSATARALHMDGETDNVKFLVEKALSLCGVPSWIIRGRVELFPVSGKDETPPHQGIQEESGAA